MSSDHGTTQATAARLPQRARRIARLVGITVASVLGITVVGAAVAYPVSDLVRPTLDSETRSQLIAEGKAGSFIATDEGIMHVRISGPADGTPIVLVHGGVVGGHGFENWQEPLVDAGYRVIVPDLLGYGYSDRPDVAYTRDFYLEQLRDLLVGLRLDEDVNLVGASFGGAVAVEYAATYPDEVATLGLMAPAGLGRGELAAPILMQRVIGDWIFRAFGGTVVTNQMATAYEGSPDRQAMLDWMNEQNRYRGFGEGILNTLRSYDSEWTPDSYKGVGAAGIPVFAAWGTEDAVHPYERTALLEELVPQVELLTLDGASHAITYGRAADVLASYVPFLERRH